MQLQNRDKQILLLIIFFIIAVFLWNTIFLYPIKLFVVLLHEISHGLMAVLLGGKILSIQIDPLIGGYCQYIIPEGRIAQIIIASAGYLGSMFWGGIILIVSSKISKDKYISLVIGIVTLLFGFFVIKTGQLFGILFILSFGIFMILSYKYLPDWFHDYILKFIGLTSCLYVLVDIAQDLILRRGIGSDADAISRLTWIPSTFIGLFWMITALSLLYAVLKITWNIKE